MAEWPSERKRKRDHFNFLKGALDLIGNASQPWEKHKIDNVRSIARFLEEEGRLPNKRAKAGVIYQGSCPNVKDEVKLGNAVQNLQQERKKGSMSPEVQLEAESVQALWARIAH
eukprot:gnl/MRDRNA2_/MRDRNA2_98019_c0_seq1.p1 gnl/MRDRNA2_/MRDRNA2_98019_c0~~gnl/MRDRNA2_/MRDRNA2_98019_c0_seq1.p1  ORF type:complete len:134 (-),score=24.11 gnl/MRDRNA2_/MRDRNA2_98019_c0_seq1:150-491(-)